MQTKEEFFAEKEARGLALTYDDVRIRTRANPDEPLPEEINIESRFSENVGLKVPFVSAAMDTVTNSKMAIEIAKIGGIGVIHAAMSVAEQRDEVRRVKMAINGKIDKPVTVSETDTLEQVINMRENRDFDFSTFPVVNADGKFVGILTGNDFKYPDSMDTYVGKAMTSSHHSQVATASTETSLSDAYRAMQQRKVNTLPLVNPDGTVGGMYLWSDVSRIYRDSEQYNVDEMTGQLRVAAAVSTGSEAIERVEKLQKYVDVVVIDTADGDSYYAFQTLKEIKAAYPDLDVVIGNISDGESARLLVDAGANGIKVGQGPGSICTTRRETGIGTPQVTAIYEAVRALGPKSSNIPVCADGGIKDHGDIPIAIAAGAHSVMMGRVLAGTKEAPGHIVSRGGSRFKVYRGMGSLSALQDNEASRKRYDIKGTGSILAEGIESLVPYEGDLSDVLGLCIQALIKGMRYAKAPDLEYHRTNTRLRMITNAGLRESHPHDVDIIR